MKYSVEEAQKLGIDITEPSQSVIMNELQIETTKNQIMREQIGNYMCGMHEIRVALQWGGVETGDFGQTERPPIKPLFDELDSARLQQRYLLLMDAYMVKIGVDPAKLK